MRRRHRIAVLTLALALAGAGPLAPAPASAAPTGPSASYLGQRLCYDWDSQDGQRQLSFCANTWWDGNGYFRGVVQMHTYKLSNGVRVGDAVSKTLTLNDAQLNSGTVGVSTFGTLSGSGTCRLNGPSGPVSSCSTANTAAVTYYGRFWVGNPQKISTCVYSLSYRDDRNLVNYIFPNGTQCSKEVCIACFATAGTQVVPMPAATRRAARGRPPGRVVSGP